MNDMIIKKIGEIENSVIQYRKRSLKKFDLSFAVLCVISFAPFALTMLLKLIFNRPLNEVNTFF
jgi:hypothetical protein